MLRMSLGCIIGEVRQVINCSEMLKRAGMIWECLGVVTIFDMCNVTTSQPTRGAQILVSQPATFTVCLFFPITPPIPICHVA